MSIAINSNGAMPDSRSGSLVHCGVDQLRPHPAYASLDLAVSAPELSALIQRADMAFQEPLIITRERTIVDGYDRWELARRQGRPTLACLEYDLSEREALVWLPQRLRPSRGVTNFCRILLALELEPGLKQRAHANLDPDRLANAFARLDSKRRESLLIAEIKVPGEVLLLSPALCQALTQQGKLIHETD